MDEHDKHDASPGSEDPEVLEGEILVRGFPYEDYSHGDGRTGPRTQQGGYGYRHKGKGHFGPRSYDEDLVKQVIAYRVSHPRDTLQDIADTFGLSRETVRRWTKETKDARSARVDVVGLRIEAAQHVETARDEAWRVYQTAATRRDVGAMRTALDALRTIGGLTGTQAQLLGLNMPVKVDVQVTELTQAEVELQELVREAQARTAAQEATVVAEASGDGTL